MQKIDKTLNNTHTKTQERKSNSFRVSMAPWHLNEKLKALVSNRQKITFSGDEIPNNVVDCSA